MHALQNYYSLIKKKQLLATATITSLYVVVITLYLVCTKVSVVFVCASVCVCNEKNVCLHT